MNIDDKLQSAFSSYEKGDLRLAKETCEEILTVQPDNALVSYLLGDIYQQSKEYDMAIHYLKRSVQLDQTNGDAYYDLGILLKQKGQLDEALACYLKAGELNPERPDVYNNIGLVFQEKEKPDEAIIYYRRAIQLNPGSAIVHYNLGNALRKKKLLDEAMSCYRKALELDPGIPDAYNDIGLVLQEEGNPDEAMTYYRKAIQLNPKYIHSYFNLGNILREKKLLNEAIRYCEKAVEFNPDVPDVYNYLGILYQEKGALNEAMDYYQKAVELNPNHAEAHWNLSLVHLVWGNLKEGWKEYEWRWKTKDFPSRSFSQPSWNGSNINSKTILLYAEQGMGDTIQFIRYAPLVAEMGATIVLECQKELTSLLKNMEWIDRAVAFGEALPPFDIQCPLLSLPLIFGTTLDNIPLKIPYIAADPLLSQAWHDKLRPYHKKLKIGLAWAGNPTHSEDRLRSCSLEIFSPLAQLGDAMFFSLQKGAPSSQARTPPQGMTLVDFTPEIKDFSDTAALMSNLDLIISVDTAVAHLAGALGRPVYTLIPFVPDWRWMLDREDSPWYPTMKLFRQSSPGDWKTVIDNVAKAIYSVLSSQPLQ